MKRCLLCNSDKRTLLYPSTLKQPHPAINQYLCTSDGYGIHGSIYRCSKCSLVFVQDQTTSRKSIINNYQQANDPTYVAQEAGRIRTFTRHLDYIEAKIKKGRILDIGAYTGLFLWMAKKKGWKINGIEPSRWAISQAKKQYDVILKNSELTKNCFPLSSFNVVTMWDVIEHFVNPVEAVQISYSLLTPGGMIAMTTIDVGSFVAKLLKSKWPWFMRMHLVYFDQKTMKNMLEKAGFINIEFRPHIRYSSLGYLSSRFKSLQIFKQIIYKLKLESILMPFYIGDLFDVYAFKPTQKQKHDQY